MEDAIDATFAEIRRLSDLIASAPSDAAREALEQKREALRKQAHALADATKSVPQLEAELANVVARLAAMDETQIKPAWVEGHKWINDPSAYRRRINESIEDNDAPQRDQLETRRNELRAALRTAVQPD
ncbi:MAG: hypothetical protein GY720_13400 [bacterium]|nr:hypothetical protein [bacterium]